jgi:hypothetical protein
MPRTMKYLIYLFCYLFASFYLHSQSINQTYVYPLKPGMEGWESLKSGEEKISILRIPDSILLALTTNALVQTCLNYPLLFELLFANDLPTGLRAVINNFNGLNELVNRKDAGNELLQVYNSYGLNELNQKIEDHDKVLYCFDITYLELLLSHPKILHTLSKEDRKVVLKSALVKYEIKKINQIYFGDLGLTSTSFLIASILEKDGLLRTLLHSYSNQEIEIFLSKAFILKGSSIREALINAAKGQ